MQFQTHTLKEPLKDYIESIFHFSGFSPDHSIERVVPTTHLYIVFELDGFERKVYNNSTLKPIQNYKDAWVIGMHKNYLSISAHQASEMLVVQFKPFGGYPFFHFPIEDLNEKILPATMMFGNELTELRTQMKQFSEPEVRFILIENWLNHRFETKLIPPVEMLQFIESLKQAPAEKYQEVIDIYPYTQKHLIDQFKKYVGYTPKYFQRILRFGEILQRIHKKDRIEWTQIAYQCGFSDQSHFIKEFKHFSGFNPKAFISQDLNYEETNFFPIDR
jgi:AraC-like DNA-binding protein